MAFSPAWGVMHPLVKIGSLGRFRGLASRRREMDVLILFVSGGRSKLVRVAWARFLATSKGKALVKQIQSTLQIGGRTASDRQLRELYKEIDRFLREQQRVPKGQRLPRGIAVPLQFGSTLNVGTLARAFEVSAPMMSTVPVLVRRKTKPDESDREAFSHWFERRWKLSPIKWQQLK